MTTILMLGDSITAGVWGQMVGQGGTRVAPTDWNVVLDWGIAQLIQDTQVRSNNRLLAGENYDVVVVSSGVGNAVAEATPGFLWQGQWAGLDTLLPTTLDIAQAWLSKGSTVILTAGPGVKPGFDDPNASPAPSTPINQLASTQGMYLSHWANLVQCSHRPILSYALPRHRMSYWAPGTDYVHLSYEGYAVCAKRLKREIERRVA